MRGALRVLPAAMELPGLEWGNSLRCLCVLKNFTSPSGASSSLKEERSCWVLKILQELTRVTWARCLFGACLLASRESSVPDLQLGNLRFMKLSGHLLLGLGYVGTMDLDIVGSWVQCGLRNQSGFRRDHSHGRNLVSKENMAEIKSPKRT